MDRYQGKNLDRYQEEIRRAAAKGVKDLNLSGSLTPNMSATSASPVGRALPRKLSSSSVGTSNSEVQGRNRNLSDTNIGQTSISVSAAAARIEHLQRLNQINISNVNGGRALTAPPPLQMENDPNDASERRRSTGPIMAAKMASIPQPSTTRNQLIRTPVNHTKNTTSSLSSASCGGVIADFAFGNNNIVENISNNSAHVGQRMSPLTLYSNDTSTIEQNQLPQVQQLTAKFDHVLNSNTTNSNQRQILNNGNNIASTQSSRQSSVSPFASRVSPLPTAVTFQPGQTGIVSGLSATQASMVLGNQQNSTNNIAISLANPITRQSTLMVSNI